MVRRLKEDYYPSHRWSLLQTTGKQVMPRRLAFAATTSEDVYSMTVPDGKRWVFFGGSFTNCTLSSGTNVCYVKIYDDNMLGIQTIWMGGTSASETMYPFPTNNDVLYVAGGCGYPLFAGETIKVACGASANKSGSWKIHYNILEFDVGKGR